MAPPKASTSYESAPQSGTSTPSPADSYSYASHPRPFKNPEYKRHVPANKRTKNLKQIVAGERERGDRGGVATYTSTEAPPSVWPSKKYCDVTGLEAPYQDPKSTLRYHNAEVYEVLKTFQPSVIQSYLGVRGMGVMLR